MRSLHQFALAVLLLPAIATSAFGLTVPEQVTSQYLNEHPNELSIKVSKGKNGLIDFKVTRTLSSPKYLVVHLVLNHKARVIAESHDPTFTRNRENTFYFSLSPEDLGESTFELGESAFTESGGQAVPIVGTVLYQFHLKEFVPEELVQQSEANPSSRAGLTFPSQHVR